MPRNSVFTSPWNFSKATFDRTVISDTGLLKEINLKLDYGPVGFIDWFNTFGSFQCAWKNLKLHLCHPFNFCHHCSVGTVGLAQKRHNFNVEQLKMLPSVRAEGVFVLRMVSSLVFICFMWIGRRPKSKSGWQQLSSQTSSAASAKAEECPCLLFSQKNRKLIFFFLCKTKN